MTLDNLPKKTTKVFSQRDVRETPASTATATSVGLTDPLYITLSTHADLVNERVLTAGEGIDFTDNGAGGTLVINGELATDTGNKGIATFNATDFDVAAGVVTIDDSGVDHNAITNTHNMTTDIDARMTPGEGINYVAGTISAETASETNRGIATFDGTDFVVTTGDVTLKATVCMSIDGDSGTATPAVHNIDILGGTGITTAGAGNDITITTDDANIDHDALNNFVANEHLDWTGDLGATNIHSGNYTNTTYTAGEGLDLAGGVFSGENASTTNKGIAKFAAGNGMDVGASSGTITYTAETATATNPGVVELATIAETQTGTDETRAVTPNSLFDTTSPVGAVIAWLKSYTNTPQALPTGWVECAGQTLSDAESVYNGQVIPDLNGGEFLRGNSTSGGTGGSATMAHTHTLDSAALRDGTSSGTDFDSWSPFNVGRDEGDPGAQTTSAASNTENRPPYFDVVWIMRIK